VPATQYRVAQGGIRCQVRLIQRIFERCRRCVVGVPQQGGFIRGDEQHPSGVEHGCVDDPVVPAWPAAWDGLWKDRPAAVEAVAERLQQGLEVLSREGLERKEFPHVPEAERELLVTELDDLLGDVRLQDSASIQSPPFPVASLVFRIFVVFVGVIHFGIGWRQFLEHQVLRLNGLIQEAKDSPMKSGIQLVGCFASVLLGGRFLESHPAPFHHPGTDIDLTVPMVCRILRGQCLPTR
jgi:hypothetical protein